MSGSGKKPRPKPYSKLDSAFSAPREEEDCPKSSKKSEKKFSTAAIQKSILETKEHKVVQSEVDDSPPIQITRGPYRIIKEEGPIPERPPSPLYFPWLSEPFDSGFEPISPREEEKHQIMKKF
jgi:hypothetical protein